MALLGVINGGIEAACDEKDSCTFVNSGQLCDYDSATGYSSGAYHADSIHLSEAGYCKVFGEEGVQTALGCVAGNVVDCGAGSIVGCNGVGEAEECRSWKHLLRFFK